MARYIFVTGGVVSSLGKGLSSASLAYLLKSQGYKVRIRKIITKRTKFKLPILYGGSVNKKNISTLKNVSGINGYLIGSASQSTKKFIDIIKKTIN